MTRGDAWGGVGQGSRGAAGEKKRAFRRGHRDREVHERLWQGERLWGGRNKARREEGSSQAWIHPEAREADAGGEKRAAITYADERWDRQRAGDGETEFVRRGSWKNRRGARATYVFRLAVRACARSIE